MTVAIVGSLSVGIVVGWLVRFFIRRFKKFGPAALSAVISVLLGGTVVRFLEADPSVIWYYPIGLLAGFIIYTIVAVLGALFEWWMASRGGAKSPGGKKAPPFKLPDGIYTIFRR